MTVAALRAREWLPAGAVPRGIIAGTAWGLIMGLGLPLMTFMTCGVICVSDVALTTAVSVVAGIAIIGPLAAFRHSSALRGN
ncbi:MAG: hypothetical protein GEU95_20225 [Rhizobiales bacterium]|nr:hypothetical protein [Hyphomicrobiales bacterium]